MESLSLLLENPTYFSQNTPSNIKKEFIKNMYLTIIPNAFFIYSSLQLTNYGLLNLFFDSGFSDGIFVIIFYALFISTALLYCNFDQITEDYDIKPYTYLFTFCFSYIFSYFTYYLETDFFILNGNYLLTLFSSIVLYTSQNLYNFNYNSLIKISFLSNILVFLILYLIYLDFQYILFTYLTSSFSKLYIIHDTESIVTSSNRKFNVKTNQYSTASVLLYLDLFNIFPWILYIFTGR
jgi:hypothetical protein